MAMETLEEIKAKARQKVESEMETADSNIGRIGQICLSWIGYADNAAKLILTKGKTLQGALDALRKFAAENKGQRSAYCIDSAKAMEIILEYFGQEDSQGVVEGGLMYHCMLDAAEKFKPYGTELPRIGMEPKAQPVAERSLSALESLRLEDFGL